MIRRNVVSRYRSTRPVSNSKRSRTTWVSTDNTASTELSGGIGNIFFKLFFTISYALKHGIKYYFSEDVRNPHSKTRQYEIPCTGVAQDRTTSVNELKDENGFPYLQELPLYQNPVFSGYWQSFNFINAYKSQLVELFKLPTKFNKGIVSIHVRRGDATGQPNEFPMLLKQYYDDAIAYMNNEGHFKFKVYSDDIEFAKVWFTKENYPKCSFKWQDTETDYDTMMDLVQCEHHIVARSTFSFMAAWICPNKSKIVCCPPFPLFKHCHKDIVPQDWVVIDTEINTKTPQVWAQHKKIPVSFAKLPNRKKLDNVTLLAVATRNVEATAKALMYSCKAIDYGDVHLVSPYRPSFFPSQYRWTFIEPFASIDDWNHHIYYFLWKYFDTSHTILIHDDGYVCNPEIWKDEWLKYDYIGSPYSMAFSEKLSKQKNQPISRIGNSVGLRSRRLCKLPSELGFEWRKVDGNYNEDVKISVHCRQQFEKEGMVFAPLQEAILFGRETEFEENAKIDKTFLFHKFKGKNAQYPQF